MTLQNIDQLRPHAISFAQSAVAWHRNHNLAYILAEGKDRTDLLHRLTTNDLSTLSSSHGIQTVLVTEKARILDVLTVLQGDDSALIIGSASTSESTIGWIRKYVIMDDVRLRDHSGRLDSIEIIGPQARGIAEDLLGREFASFAICDWMFGTVGELPVRAVRVPSSCEVAVRLIGETDAINEICNELSKSNSAIPELTPNEVEYLRILSGMGKHGNEWSDAYNPLEAGLLHLTSFTKGCYIGQEVVARLDSYNKVKQRVMGLTSTHPISTGSQILFEGKPIGMVTSSVRSIVDDVTYSLAYIRGEHAHDGSTVLVKDSEDIVKATVSLLPFGVN